MDIVQEVVTETIPKKKKRKEAKWLSEEALQIAEKRREEAGGQGGEREGERGDKEEEEEGNITIKERKERKRTMSVRLSVQFSSVQSLSCV